MFTTVGHVLTGARTVAALGFYTGVYSATSKSMTPAFAHLYELKDGKITRMAQYVDSATVQKALS